MKKILSIALILVCVCALFACGGGGNKFVNAVANTNPDTATITTVTTTELGDLTGTFTVTYGDDGAATIEYSYEQWNKVGEGDEPKSTVTGTITRQEDGSYSDGKGFTGTADEVTAGFNLNLESVVETAEVNAAGDTLTATVLKADTETVLGVAFDYDVELKVVINGDVVETITVTFENGGNSGSITCKYK